MELLLLAALIGATSSVVVGRVFSAISNPYKDYCDRWEAINNKNQQTIEKLFGALEERDEQCNAWRECAERLIDYAHESLAKLVTFGNGYERYERQMEQIRADIAEFERLKEGSK